MVQDLFERNLGVIGSDAQQQLKNGSVLIVGAGGIGGTVAHILARSGLGTITLVDPDRYVLSNINRQIAATTNTVGEYKVEVLKSQLLQINPSLKIKTFTKILSRSELEKQIVGHDFVFPAADDFPYSLDAFAICQRKGKHALMVVPRGWWAMVTVIAPDNVSAAWMTAMPEFDLAGLRWLYSQHNFHSKRRHFFSFWLEAHNSYSGIDFDENVPQICPVVWSASSMGAKEIVRYFCGLNMHATAPKCWWFKDGRVALIDLSSIRSLTGWGMRFWRRKIKRIALSYCKENSIGY